MDVGSRPTGICQETHPVRKDHSTEDDAYRIRIFRASDSCGEGMIGISRNTESVERCKPAAPLLITALKDARTA